MDLPNQATGGKRESYVELNLVPFIDLLSVLITFLLITAVWTQISTLQVGTSLHGDVNKASPFKAAKKSQNMSISVRRSGYALYDGSRTTNVPLINGEHDVEGLKRLLANMKRKYPSEKGMIIFSQDAVNYDVFIGAMDASLSTGFAEIGLSFER